MLNFKEIISNTTKYNFHSHTQFCDGRADMEDFVKEAIMQGFEHYGFSPHSPTPFTTSCNMEKGDVQLYFSEFERLKSIYGDKINLYKSMEIDYIDNDWNANNEYFNNLGLDYKISSVHFIPSFINEAEFIDIDGRFASFKEKMHQYFNDDIEKVVRSFYAQSLKMINAGGFDIIGHFDKIGHNGNMFSPGIEEKEWYKSLVRETFDAIMDNKYIIEINTKALKEFDRVFPHTRYWDWLRKYKVPVLINSDAHVPALVNAGREEVYKCFYNK